MLPHYLFMAMRSFARHKLYSFINFLGLSVALTCVTFVILFVRYQLSYDTWIPGAQSLYRAELTLPIPGAPPLNSATTPNALGPAGPSLEEGRPVGWSFSPGAARQSPSGAYQGALCGVLRMGMERYLSVRLGAARVCISSISPACTRGDSCRLDIDPTAIQVWPLG